MANYSTKTQARYKVAKASASNDRELILTHVITGEENRVTVEEAKDGTVEYAGLPAELRDFLYNFTVEELLENPEQTVHNIIRMNAMIAGGMSGLITIIEEDED